VSVAAAVRPEDLRAAARTLRLTGGRLHAMERAVTACRPAGPTWRGVASAAQAQRLGTLARSLGACSPPLDLLARAVEQFAGQAEAAQRERHRLVCRRTELDDRRRRLVAAPPHPADPGAVAHQARLQALATEVLGVDRSLDHLEEQLEAGRRALAGVLDAVLPPRLPGELETLARLVVTVGGAVGAVRRIQRGAMVLAESVRHARATDLGERLLRATRLDELLQKAQRAPWWTFGSVALQRLVHLAGVPGALRDVLTGGGHDGVRGVLTRVNGAVGLAGAGALLYPAPVPHLKMAGLVAAGVHTLGKAGFWVHDNWDKVTRLGGVAWQLARRRAEELGEQLLRRTPTLPWGPLGPLPPVLGPGQGWDGLRDLLPDLPELRLPDLPELRLPDLPELRLPELPNLDLPELPLGPVVRLPIVTPGGLILPVDPWGWLRD
jgi:hypothetical protein